MYRENPLVMKSLLSIQMLFFWRPPVPLQTRYFLTFDRNNLVGGGKEKGEEGGEGERESCIIWPNVG